MFNSLALRRVPRVLIWKKWSCPSFPSMYNEFAYFPSHSMPSFVCESKCDAWFSRSVRRCVLTLRIWTKRNGFAHLRYICQVIDDKIFILPIAEEVLETFRVFFLLLHEILSYLFISEEPN